MKKQKQLIVHRQIGDCWRACIACILNVPVQTVPNFIEVKGTKTNNWYISSWNWLNKRGYKIQTIDGNTMRTKRFYIVSVNSYNFKDISHAVIYRGKKPYWDVNPLNRDVPRKPKWVYAVFEITKRRSINSSEAGK